MKKKRRRSLMPLLPNIYNDFLLSKGFFEYKGRRPLIEHALNLLEETSKEGGVLFLQLPTGYGKTAITFASFFRAIADPEFFWRVIHVSPLRSIIDDIYRRMRDSCRRVLANIQGYDAEHLEKLVGAQMMLFPGSPYLQKRLTITTFDTLSLSLAKMPVKEISEIARGVGHGHFDIPRASILEALVIMDEIHTFLSEAGESDALQILTSIIFYLVESRIPLVLMSATMPKIHTRKMLSNLRNISHPFYYKEVYYGDEGAIDKDWENEQISKRVETKILRGDIRGIVEKSLDLSSRYDRTLVVLNTIPRALQVYRELKKNLRHDQPLILLHSKFRKIDRDNKLKIIAKEKKWLLVSTQVIEAGVDISADALITDVSPANNLVQRAGRVARRPSDREGIVVIVEEAKEVKHGFGVYDEGILKTTLEELKKYVDSNEVRILWRSLDCHDYIGYQKFVDEVYSRGDWHFSMDSIYYRLISSFEWSPQDAVAHLVELYNGSFLRKSPLIPLIIGMFDELNYENLIENSVPIDLDDIKRMLRKGIKVEKVAREGEEVMFEELKTKDLNNLVRAIVVGKVMALRALEPEVVYTKTEGLVVDENANGC